MSKAPSWQSHGGQYLTVSIDQPHPVGNIRGTLPYYLLGRCPYSEKELDFLAGATKKKDFRDNASNVAVPRLIKALGSADAKVRKKAAEGLHGFGALARPAAVPALLKVAVQELDVPARYAARQALKAIDPETYKKALEP